MGSTPRTTLGKAARPERLWAAWAKVAGGSPRAGSDGLTVADFARHLDRHLAALGQQLRSGSYEPQPLVQRHAKVHEKIRRLCIPTVRDRIAQRTVLDTANRTLDRELAESSFAYRRRRSWLTALNAVQQCRQEGLRWVVRIDIRDFFEQVDHDTLRAELSTTLDRGAVETMMAWVQAPVIHDNGVAPNARGIPQGAPISPALANRYLHSLDQRVHNRVGRLVRYADDIAVFCPDEAQAVRADAAVREVLADLRLEANPAKSYLSHFDRGFAFLGWVFFRDGGYEEAPTPGWTHPLSSPNAAAGRAV